MLQRRCTSSSLWPLPGSSTVNAVGRVTWNEPGTSIEQNAYYFLVLESAWRIEALRASVVPSFVRELESARRDLCSDQQLRAWFTDHRAALERIAERVRTLESGKEDRDAELRVELDAVGLRSAWMLDGGRVEITVGGWADNAVGLGHAPEELGALFEDWASGSPAEAQRTEVDAVLRRGKEFLAIEVQSSRAEAPSDLAGLRAIAELPGLVRRVVVCRAERKRITEDGIEILPVAELLAERERGTLWP